MRRAVLLCALALAGCGGADEVKEKKQQVERKITETQRETEKAIERVRDSTTLPEDVKKELEEAAELLEDQSP